MLVDTFDLHLGRHGKGHPIARGTKGVYLLVCPWLLPPEIVGGEADDHQAVLALFVELLKLGVLRRKAAFGGYIYDYYFFAGKIGKTNMLIINSFYSECVYAIHSVQVSAYGCKSNKICDPKT